MSKNIAHILIITTSFLAFVFITSCGGVRNDDNIRKSGAQLKEPVNTGSDIQRLKKEIQELEKQWAIADNARDVNALLEFYADDAKSMVSGKPAIEGKPAIRNAIMKELSRRAVGSTILFETLDLYGCEDQLTEVGNTIIKDSTGKIVSTSKYMAIWEKRDGRYFVVRDIGNDD